MFGWALKTLTGSCRDEDGCASIANLAAETFEGNFEDLEVARMIPADVAHAEWSDIV